MRKPVERHYEHDFIASLYRVEERALLYDFFGIPRPGDLGELDLEELGIVSGRVICWFVYHRHDGLLSSSVNGAVARLLLAGVQHRRRQWAGGARETGPITCVGQWWPRPGAIRWLPRFLFSVDWGRCGGGSRWPEAYNLAYVPGFDRYVLTVSACEEGGCQCPDVAVGHFEGALRCPDTRSVGEFIVAHWGLRASKGCERWVRFLEAGEVHADVAEAWAKRAWSSDGVFGVSPPSKEE